MWGIEKSPPGNMDYLYDVDYYSNRYLHKNKREDRGDRPRKLFPGAKYKRGFILT